MYHTRTHCSSCAIGNLRLPSRLASAFCGGLRPIHRFTYGDAIFYCYNITKLQRKRPYYPWCHQRNEGAARINGRVEKRVSRAAPDTTLAGMDSIPQELTDAIIDNLPYSSLRCSSLVTKGWRKRSQQRLFHHIHFSSERVVNGWHANTQNALDGVSSYVHLARFYSIGKWDDPALFIRVLENLSSLTGLWMYQTEIPDGLPDYISRREFGKRITALYLYFPQCTPETVISTSLSFPNLKRLTIGDHTSSGELPSTSFASPRTGPFDLLRLSGHVDEAAETFVKFRFASRRLNLGVGIPCLQDLLTLSSEIVTVLVFEGVCSFLYTRTTGALIEVADLLNSPPSPINLPPFPALVSLHISFGRNTRPSPQLINILSSISSTPSLASISIQHFLWYTSVNLDEQWIDLDRCLARIAKNATVEGGLTLVLKKWPRNQLLWEGFLPELRRVVGEIKTDFYGLDYY